MVTLDYIFDNVVIRGTPNAVVDGILALHEKIGDFGTLLYCGKDWADPALGRKSMELMAEKVMPAVNAAHRQIGRRGIERTKPGNNCRERTSMSPKSAGHQAIRAVRLPGATG